MSKNDMHPALKHQANLDGWTDTENIDHSNFVNYQAFKALLHSPETRMQALNDLDRAIAAEDGTSIRSKAQLLEVRRRIAHTDAAMRKAGR
jgi:hypothetical protein